LIDGGSGGQNLQDNSAVVTIAEAKQEIVSTPTDKERDTPDNSPASVNILEGEFSGYTASEDETDSSPNIMANGKTVFVGAIANNCLDFGTKVKVNGKEYIVSDRMNPRYDCNNFDIYFETKDDARKFGRQTREYEIIN